MNFFGIHLPPCTRFLAGKLLICSPYPGGRRHRAEGSELNIPTWDQTPHHPPPPHHTEQLFKCHSLTYEVARSTNCGKVLNFSRIASGGNAVGLDSLYLGSADIPGPSSADIQGPIAWVSRAADCLGSRAADSFRQA